MFVKHVIHFFSENLNIPFESYVWAIFNLQWIMLII